MSRVRAIIFITALYPDNPVHLKCGYFNRISCEWLVNNIIFNFELVSDLSKMSQAVPRRRLTARRWRYITKSAVEVRAYLHKQTSREKPPIAAYLLAVEDLGLVEEVDKIGGIIDVQWDLFDQIFGNFFDLNELLADSGCVCVDNLCEYDHRLDRDVRVRRFRVTGFAWSTFQKAFLRAVVRKLIFYFPQKAGHTTNVYLTVDCLLTPKFRRCCVERCCVERFEGRADFRRILCLFQTVRDSNVRLGWLVIQLLRDAFVKFFPQISYVIYCFSYDY